MLLQNNHSFIVFIFWFHSYAGEQMFDAQQICSSFKYLIVVDSFFYQLLGNMISWLFIQFQYISFYRTFA